MSKQKLLTRDEYFRWLKTLPKGVCSFCENSDNIVVKTGTCWSLMFCIAPYWPNHLMLVPKRHFVEFTDMQDDELTEFLDFYRYIMSKLRTVKLLHSDESPVDRYLFFWRKRENQIDPVTNVVKTDHFHFHIVPEKEHLWDSIVDNKATLVNVDILIKHFQK